MSDNVEPAAAGWYPTPDGEQRYWDGTSWLDIPAPPTAPQTPVTATNDAATSQPPKTTRRPLLVALSAVGAVVVVAGVVGGIAAASRPTPKPTHTAPPTFDVTGSLTLTDGSGVLDLGEGMCAGQNGYDDITAGAQVDVYDASGKVLATSSLEPGTPATDGLGGCTFNFDVPGVPAGLKLYQVQVSHRGMLTESYDEMNHGLQLTLG